MNAEQISKSHDCLNYANICGKINWSRTGLPQRQQKSTVRPTSVLASGVNGTQETESKSRREKWAGKERERSWEE